MLYPNSSLVSTCSRAGVSCSYKHPPNSFPSIPNLSCFGWTQHWLVETEPVSIRRCCRSHRHPSSMDSGRPKQLSIDRLCSPFSTPAPQCLLDARRSKVAVRSLAVVTAAKASVVAEELSVGSVSTTKMVVEAPILPLPLIQASTQHHRPLPHTLHKNRT